MFEALEGQILESTNDVGEKSKWKIKYAFVFYKTKKRYIICKRLDKNVEDNFSAFVYDESHNIYSHIKTKDEIQYVNETFVALEDEKTSHRKRKELQYYKKLLELEEKRTLLIEKQESREAILDLNKEIKQIQKEIKLENLRKTLEEDLKQIQPGQRIKINKKELEELLFSVSKREFIIHEYMYKPADIQLVRLKEVVWSGDFLSKIDLSEVSFDDIDLQGSQKKNFENTNANIDFKKLFGYEFYPDDSEIRLINCNFRNVDLSKNNVPNYSTINDCDLTNSKLKFSDISKVYLRNVNLSDLDLSQMTVSEDFFSSEECIYDGPRKSINCCFKNTGLNIKFEPLTESEIRTYNLYIAAIKRGQPISSGEDESSIRKAYEIRMNLEEKDISLIPYDHSFTRDPEDFRRRQKIASHVENIRIIEEHLKRGFLDGCCINGIKVNSTEARQIIEFEKKSDLASLVSDSTEVQKKGSK